MSDVYVVGADLIKFGRYPDRTPAQLGAEATLLALDDAGLNIGDVGALYAASTFNAASMIAQQILFQIGQTGIPCVNVSNACAAGATAFREAFIAVKSGLYDVVVAVGAEKNPAGMLSAGRRQKVYLAQVLCQRCLPRRVYCMQQLTAQPWSSSPKCR